jgi:TIR domain
MSSVRGRGGIFISYRREETAANAGRLYDRLSERFGEERVFMDVDSIDIGVDFTRAVIEAVSGCNILLALIGRDWSAITDSKGRRRIDNPDDFVRVEIETALQRDIRVVPVLVDGAVLPQANDLPPSLQPLTRRQALELSHTSFRSEISRLVAAVDEVVEAQPGRSADRKAQEEAAGRRAEDKAQREAQEAARRRAQDQAQREAQVAARWRAEDQADREAQVAYRRNAWIIAGILAAIPAAIAVVVGILSALHG